MKKRRVALAVRYAAFAAVATGVNLLVQWVATLGGRAAWPDQETTLTAAGFAFTAADLSYWAALAAGTLAGFAIKYLLDKRFIFRHRAASAGAGLASLFLYGVTALITTFVFWGIQYAFTRIGPEDVWKYAGGFCGLAPGYVLKYFLDKRFTFRAPPADVD